MVAFSLTFSSPLLTEFFSNIIFLLNREFLLTMAEVYEEVVGGALKLKGVTSGGVKKLVTHVYLKVVKFVGL